MLNIFILNVDSLKSTQETKELRETILRLKASVSFAKKEFLEKIEKSKKALGLEKQRYQKIIMDLKEKSSRRETGHQERIQSLEKSHNEIQQLQKKGLSQEQILKQKINLEKEISDLKASKINMEGLHRQIFLWASAIGEERKRVGKEVLNLKASREEMEQFQAMALRRVAVLTQEKKRGYRNKF